MKNKVVNKSVATYLRANVKGQRDLNPKSLRLNLNNSSWKVVGLNPVAGKYFFALNVINAEFTCFIFFSCIALN